MDNHLSPFIDAVENQPDNWLAHAQLAGALHQSGESQRALTAINKAIELENNQPLLFGLLADIEMTLGNKTAAIQSLEKGVAIDAKNPDLNSALGLLLLDNADVDESIRRLTIAARSAPEARHWFNLGNALKESGDFDSAIQHYQSALEIDKAYLRAYRNMALCMIEVNQYDGASEQLSQALSIDDQHAQTWYMYGFVQRLLDDFSEATESFKKCVKLDPTHEQAREMLGRTLTELEDFDSARDCFKQWLSFDPENAIARHMLNALSGTDATDRASQEYVAAAFDQFADSFETVLGKLQYQVPQLIKQKLSQPGLSRRYECILDAGCGTGLCGPILEPLTELLIGVDLSAKMLERAQASGHYDQLLCRDLVDFMNETPARFDLVIAADTFNYFGDLQQLFSALNKCLTENGRVVFTLEQSPVADRGFQLNHSGRFKHSLEFIRESLEVAGLSIHEHSIADLRVENEKRVPGFLIVAQKTPEKMARDTV